MKAKVVVAEDDPVLRDFLVEALGRLGHRVEAFADGAAAAAAVEARGADLVLTDLRLPGADGIEVLRRAQRAAPEAEVIVITAYGTVEGAVEAMKAGAADFLLKPFGAEILEAAVDRALERARLADEVRAHRRALRRPLVGRSAAWRRVLDLVERVAPTDTTVLLTGETGTGKEVVAREIHARSRRSDRRFVAVNSSAVPAGLVEAEMFGHEKGAFTGADRRRAGLVEAADGGTLFLDEVGDLAGDLQAKLLRFLQERTFRRVGGREEISADVRVIAATHRDLEAEVSAGRFREDLYWRLAVIEIRLPPLRDRREDIPVLVAHFVERFAAEMNRRGVTLAPGAAEAFAAYAWPGNVRELENAVERAVVLAADGVVRGPAGDAPGHRLAGGLGGSAPEAGSAPGLLAGAPSLPALLERVEREAIGRALAATGGVAARAARLLGLKRTTLVEKMNRYGIKGSAG